MANGLHVKSLAQSETLCTWRSSLRGTWEVSPVPGLVPGRLRKAIAVRRACTRVRSRMRSYRGNDRTKEGNFRRRSWREGPHPRGTAEAAVVRTLSRAATSIQLAAGPGG